MVVASSKVVSHSEVSAHKTSQDCWVIINAKAYDVTSFLNDHPGGGDVLLAAAGKDVSQEFEDAGHGSAARLMLDEFYVGEIDSSFKSNIETMDTSLIETRDAKDISLQLCSNKFLFTLAALMIVAFGVGIGFNTIA